LYNDVSVLENHHLASSFKMMTGAHKRILQGLNPADYAHLRSIVIALVQATDMKTHFTFLSEAQAKLGRSADTLDDHEYSELPQEERIILFKMAMKCADISNPSKPIHLSARWAERVMAEFFAQGDREKALGLAVSPMCDRESTAIPKSQLGFIDFVVLPLFNTWAMHLPWLHDNVLPYLHENKKHWQAKHDEEQERTNSQVG